MEETKKRGLSGAVLKWIALVTMLIDHIGLTVVYQALIYDRDLWLNDTMMTLYAVLRSVGRLAFPLFCFLLAEGFRHTSSRGKYLLRLAVFALLSEIPFDLAVNSRVIEFSSQNVFFTLLLGLAGIWAWDYFTDGKLKDCELPRLLAALTCMAAAVWAGSLLSTDYQALGVLLILAFYLLRERPWLRDLSAALIFCGMVWLEGSWRIELFALLALPLMHLYNGERGRQIKYFFYCFYPGHFLLLSLLRWIIMQAK